MGIRNELRGGIVATVGRRVRGAVAWSLSHSDSRLVTRGLSATIAAAKSDAITAAPAYALTLADALDARATALSSRAAAIRAAVG
jgi:hypothetical protein